jgi:hypothetical protein
VLGADVSALAQEIGAYDVAKVIAATNPKSSRTTRPTLMPTAMEQSSSRSIRNFVFLTHTYQVRDFALRSLRRVLASR